MKILVLDNYDSFTYNLVHLIESIVDIRVEVYRNDTIDISYIKEFDTIFLSPGPGLPEEEGRMKEIIRLCHHSHKIFGVCLGMQAIAEVFGAKLKNLNTVFHGVAHEMYLPESSHILFNGVPHRFLGARYHSWVVSMEDLPNELSVLCKDQNDEIMALQYSNLPVCGVQYHPESILTEYGREVISNFLFQM
ncbi:MAG: aminodeoxychorismate/anthranilate synthase component II [Marinilabiliales bacterium]|nr:MAG: aminodeoxychorismate/anthranilate synthase component II [Marinilabiliales bacterium]